MSTDSNNLQGAPSAALHTSYVLQDPVGAARDRPVDVQRPTAAPAARLSPSLSRSAQLSSDPSAPLPPSLAMGGLPGTLPRPPVAFNQPGKPGPLARSEAIAAAQAAPIKPISAPQGPAAPFSNPHHVNGVATPVSSTAAVPVSSTPSSSGGAFFNRDHLFQSAVATEAVTPPVSATAASPAVPSSASSQQVQVPAPFGALPPLPLPGSGPSFAAGSPASTGIATTSRASSVAAAAAPKKRTRSISPAPLQEPTWTSSSRTSRRVTSKRHLNDYDLGGGLGLPPAPTGAVRAVSTPRDDFGGPVPTSGETSEDIPLLVAAAQAAAAVEAQHEFIQQQQQQQQQQILASALAASLPPLPKKPSNGTVSGSGGSGSKKAPPAHGLVVKPSAGAKKGKGKGKGRASAAASAAADKLAPRVARATAGLDADGDEFMDEDDDVPPLTAAEAAAAREEVELPPPEEVEMVDEEPEPEPELERERERDGAAAEAAEAAEEREVERQLRFEVKAEEDVGGEAAEEEADAEGDAEGEDDDGDRADGRPAKKRRRRWNGKRKGGKRKEGEKPILQDAPPPSHAGYILQTLPCSNSKQTNPLRPLLHSLGKCHECTTRRQGYTCLFRNLRSFKIDYRTGLPTNEFEFLDTLVKDEEPEWVTDFDRDFTLEDTEAIKSAASPFLIPWLKRELEHARQDHCAKIKRELGVTATCDACATVLAGGSWICKCCGRELCFDCHEMVNALVLNEYTDAVAEFNVEQQRAAAANLAALSGMTNAGVGGVYPALQHMPTERPIRPTLNKEPTQSLLDQARTLHPATAHKMRLCLRQKRPAHFPEDLVPLARIGVFELRRLVKAMEEWEFEHGPEAAATNGKGKEKDKEVDLEIDAEWLQKHRVRLFPEENGHDVVHVPGQLLPPGLDDDIRKMQEDAAAGVTGESASTSEFSAAPAASASTSAAASTSTNGFATGAGSAFDPALTRDSPLYQAADTYQHLAGVQRLPPSPELLESHLRCALPAAFAALAPESRPYLQFFRALWRLGEPFVVDLSPVPPSGWPQLPWTPEYFVAEFGDEAVTVGSNRPAPSGGSAHAQAAAQAAAAAAAVAQPAGQGGSATPADEAKKMGKGRSRKAPGERKTTVREFFETFGRTRGKGQGEREEAVSEKIKDWPPAADFKSGYPELWHDFMQLLPAGSVTRRDGVLNLSAHSPPNSNPPDLGPKGYFSHISDDKEGGWGSTKLHMDVADALNVMLWSSPGPDGSPGVAIWDIYRSEDSPKIREFLYQRHAKLERKTPEAMRLKHDDPIHTQEFYLDEVLRRELWEQKGVKSFRIHQRPGQVVFIPAGCAHQVCNFSDCIKVASDFVSIENIGRCWTVSEEFRAQTRTKSLWRSDVLQLKSALLWAWYSAERHEKPLRIKAGKPKPGDIPGMPVA
ncbi:hypothetical protein JCM8097_000461 [Rhodosporidiobolus ruineniae]